MFRTAHGRVLNAMTVDVEEHFQVSAFERVIDRAEWETHPSRVVANTERLLGILDQAGVKATFFVLSWLARRQPALVRRIADRGHEIGSHGHSHRLVYRQTPDEFREETTLGRKILQDASGQPVNGYRAASFSIRNGNLWALDVLAEAGFRYDSSLFPVMHDRYGIPGAPRRIHTVRTPGGMSLVEVPPSTVALGPANLPVAGGGYLRLYPEFATRWAIARLNEKEAMPAVVYVHPWEVDPDQPPVPVPWRTRLRHYGGLRTTCRKLRNLTAQFRFGPVQEVIARLGFGEHKPAAAESRLETASVRPG